MANVFDNVFDQEPMAPGYDPAFGLVLRAKKAALVVTRDMVTPNGDPVIYGGMDVPILERVYGTAGPNKGYVPNETWSQAIQRKLRGTPLSEQQIDEVFQAAGKNAWIALNETVPRWPFTSGNVGKHHIHWVVEVNEAILNTFLASGEYIRTDGGAKTLRYRTVPLTETGIRSIDSPPWSPDLDDPSLGDYHTQTVFTRSLDGYRDSLK